VPQPTKDKEEPNYMPVGCHGGCSSLQAERFFDKKEIAGKRVLRCVSCQRIQDENGNELGRVKNE